MIRLSENSQENRRQISGARIAVLGAARSGVAVARLLADHGARILLSDIKSADQLPGIRDQIKSGKIDLETGGHSDRILKSDLICISPGLPLSIPILERATQQNIPIVGEIEVSSWFWQSPIYAITGSNGKTTTTTLTGIILKKMNPATIVAGNIGQPFAEFVQTPNPPQVAVLEVSSFQLETIVSFHPTVAVILNLTANHLDRYPDFESYARAKLNILKNLTPDDTLILNKDDPYLSAHVKHVRPRIFYVSQHPHSSPGAYWDHEKIRMKTTGSVLTIDLKSYHLRGPHNRYNMMVAGLLAVLQQVPEEIIAREIANFKGVEHRLEFVRRIGEVSFVNDSKATTVDSLAVALQSFSDKIILIAGGKDKGGNFSEVNPLMKQRVKAAVLIGQAAQRMEVSWREVVQTIHARDLQEAVTTAYRQAGKGDVILLSPACSSFDMFRDYEDRGTQYKEIVMGLN